MVKPFITFTKTDATRLYNDAEKKNVVIDYLLDHEFIIEITDLFLSTSPTKDKVKPEIGYLKLFPISSSAPETTSFETKLRNKVGITFDDYIGKVLQGGVSSESTSVINNIFNNTYHKWLFNRLWYEKLNAGHFSSYFENNLVCPYSSMSSTPVALTLASNDEG